MKTRLKKIVSVMLTVIMMMGLLPMNVFADDTYPQLVLDHPQEVTIAENTTETVTFTPESTGVYAFSSEVSLEGDDPYIDGVYTADGGYIDCFLGHYDDWEGYEFWAAYELNGGETYTIDLASYGEISYSVTVSKLEVVSSGELQLDTPTTIVPGDNRLFYTFVPEATGLYWFYFEDIAEGSSDPNMSLNSEVVDDHYDDGLYWPIYHLTAGEEYVLVCEDFANSAEGFKVTASKYYKVLSEPTSEKPSFGVTFPEDVKSYQWYKVQNEPITESEVTGIGTGVTYDSGTGLWTLSGDTWYDAFIINTILGEEYCVEVTGGSVRSMYLADPDAPGDAFDSFDEETDGMYYITSGFSDGALFRVYSDSTESVSFKIYETSGVAVEGQTTNTLTDFEPGERYYCEAEYTNGTKLTSETFSPEYAITRQPTAAKPSVEVNAKNGASYQWYRMEMEAAPVTAENATPYDASGMEDMIQDKASYNSATDEWSGAAYQSEDGYEYAYFTIDLKADEVLIVEPSETPIYFYVVPSEGGSPLEYTQENGKIRIPISEEGNYFVSLTAESQDVTVKASVERAKGAETLDGEITDTLTQYEKGAYYYCEVSWPNGTVITSDTFSIGNTFVHQPTADEPYVEVTYSDEVESYEWYEIEKDYITDESDEIEEKVLDDEECYDETTGEWNGDVNPINGDEENGYRHEYFSLQLKEGDVLTVQCSNNPTAHSCLSGSTDAAMEIDGNRLIFTISEDGEYWLSVVTMSEPTTIKAWLGEIERLGMVDGENSEKLTTAEIGKSYACVVTYEDGTVITSDDFTATEATIKLLEDAKKQENADAVTDKIDAIPETITINDEDAIKAAKEAYDALSEAEKALLDEDTVNKLNAALTALEELKNPNGSNDDGSNDNGSNDNGSNDDGSNDNGSNDDDSNDDDSNGNEDGGALDTGDSSNAAIWIAVLFVGCCAFGCAAYFKKGKTGFSR